MPSKRPPEEESPDSDSSSTLHPPAKQARKSESDVRLHIRVYIIQAKLDAATTTELYELAEQHTLGLCNNVEDADVIITAVSMRRRLERHVPWNIARAKAVVTAQWLRDSVQRGEACPCSDYVAVRDLEETTVQHCPDCNCKPCACSDSASAAVTPPATPRVSLGQLPSPQTSPIAHAPKAVEPSKPTDVPEYLLHPDPPLSTNLEKLDHTSRYACQRASPLVCPNQVLVRELDVIRQSRALEGEQRSALSYQRAASVIKAYPHVIRSLKQVKDLPYIGTKIINLVEEFLETGRITEAQTIQSSPRFQTLSLFSSVYGIGPSSAQRLYNLGLRTLEDLEIYYGVEREELTRHSEIVEVKERPRTPAWQQRKDAGEESLSDAWIRVALGLREDFTKKIPRAEVEEMGRVVVREMEELQPGCVSTIVGGYRRGKPESNDVDIIFTHPDASKMKGMCKRLVRKLHERGMVTHVMHLSDFHTHNPLRTHSWDSLEKALTVFTLPPSSPFYSGTRRRVDLIFALPNVYWTAVIGWTGSIMFERDLRQWAKDKHGMKFDSSGITRRYDSKEFFPQSEKEAFDLLGLEWIDPVWRNADL